MKFVLTSQAKWFKEDDVETLREVGFTIEPQEGGACRATHCLAAPTKISIEITSLEELMVFLSKVGPCLIGSGAPGGVGNAVNLGDVPALHIASDYLDFIEAE